MDENKEIAERLVYQAKLMEVLAEDTNRIGAYKNASNILRRLDTPASEMLAEDSLEALEGIGKSISDAIRSIHDTGTTPHILELESRIPTGIIEMLGISGLGPRKVAIIWKEMGIQTIGELYYACLENRLIKAKSFGLKTQEKLLKTLEFLRSNRNKFLYAQLHPHLQKMHSLIRDTLGADARVETTGEMRRKSPVAERIEFLIEPDLYKDVMLMLIRSDEYEIMTAGGDSLQATLRGTQIGFDFNFQGINYYRALFETTGPAQHTELIPLEDGHIYQSEEEIYEMARLPYIPPVLREGAGEIRKTYRNAVPTLVQETDIRGLLHAHSTWSDGRHSLREMAEACRDLGMEYLGISDHSQSAFYANGLSPERVAAQIKEIDLLNQEFSDFRILKGIESDIRMDGELDYDPILLSGFDFVIASIHSHFKMTEEQATERLLKAIMNPFTNILGHATGRLLLSREGYPIDHRAIIQACSEYQVAIELNSNPNRLDLDWKWIRYAVELGVPIAINPDAHRIEALHDYKWGIPIAQKGMVSPDLTLNAKSLPAIEEWFLSKRKRRIA